jgi:hypothetical protein
LVAAGIGVDLVLMALTNGEPRPSTGRPKGAGTGLGAG